MMSLLEKAWVVIGRVQYLAERQQQANGWPAVTGKTHVSFVRMDRHHKAVLIKGLPNSGLLVIGGGPTVLRGLNRLVQIWQRGDLMLEAQYDHAGECLITHHAKGEWEDVWVGLTV